MATVIVFANQKGGVGKTTSTANIGAALAQLGERTLLIDADPQANLGELFGVDDPTIPGLRLEDALASEAWETPPEPWTTRPDPETGEPLPLAAGVHLLPCTDELADTVAELVAVEGAEQRLRQLITLYDDHYGFIPCRRRRGCTPCQGSARCR